MGSYLEQMTKHFGEIDEYMTEKLQQALAARHDKDYAALDAIAAQVRSDGYSQFADRLAVLATLDLPAK